MTPLNPSEVDSYRDRGYLLLRQAIKSPDLASVRALILLLVDGMRTNSTRRARYPAYMKMNCLSTAWP